MAENTDNQIKSPLEKKPETQEQSVKNGTEKAIKKTLPKIAKNISNALETPIKNTSLFVGNSIKEGLNKSSESLSKGFNKLKDFGSDLLTDVIETASDIISPGGLTTMLTGSPLLGALIGNKIEEAWDSAKTLMSDIGENFTSVKDSIENPVVNIENENINDNHNPDIEIENDDMSSNIENAKNDITAEISNLSDNNDITNELLCDMLNTNKDFNNIYKEDQEQLLKSKREDILRNKELERERLDALKKQENETPIINIDNGEEKESIFSKFYKKLKGVGSGLFDSIFMIGKILAKSIIILTAIVAAFNGIYTFFNKLGDGASIKEALIAGLTDFIHVLTLGLVDKELINNLITFFVSPIYDFLAGIGKGLFDSISGIWNTVAGLFNADWERVKDGLFEFGKGIEDIFNSIIDFFVDIVENLFSIGEKIGGWFSGWFSDEDEDEQEKKKNERKKSLENIRFNKSDESSKPIIENSKQITQMQTPIHTTIINNNTNNTTQMSNNNAIGKTNMIVGSSLRNNDPTFNQCLIGNMIPNM